MLRYREMFRLGTLLSTGIVAGAVALAAQTPASTPAPAKAPATKMAKPAMAHHDMDADAIKWEPAPPNMPAGAMMAVLVGDPSKAGELFVARLKAPDGYRVMPHTHPTDEHVTMIKGTFVMGMGEKWDDKAMKPLSTGSFKTVPKETAHFGACRGETIIEVTAIGPFAMKYVNPDDDPSMKKAPTSSK